jgi:hypothetical protein
LFFRGLFIIMAGPDDKFFLHVTPVEKSINIERHPFCGFTLDQLRPWVGDRSGHCHVELTRRYFRNPAFVIAGDDNFANKGWPVTTIINERWFRGALVVLAERNRDPAGQPFLGETFLDGLTAEECKEASPYIALPPGAPRPKFPYPPRPSTHLRPLDDSLGKPGTR